MPPPNPIVLVLLLDPVWLRLQHVRVHGDGRASTAASAECSVGGLVGGQLDRVGCSSVSKVRVRVVS